jgi:Glycosyltransferase family 87
VRLALLIAFLLSMLLTITQRRPDLLQPTTFGSDTWNYESAAERFVVRHSVYRLVKGDRPAPVDNPPFWQSPYLYPPSMAMIWSPLLVIPDGARQLVWWGLTVGVSVAVVVFLLLALALPAVVLAIPLVVLISVIVWSGNVNGLLLAVAALAWFAHGRDATPRLRAVGDVAIALATAVKFTPVALIVWLVHQRAWRSIATVVVVGLAVTGVSLLIAGPRSAVAAYIDVVGTTAPTPQSATGLATQLGLPPHLAVFAPYVAMAIGSLAVLLIPSPRWSFAVAWATAVLATPALRTESFGLLLGCLVPWIGDAIHVRPRAVVATAAGAAVAVAAMTASVGTGALTRSSLALVNDTKGPAIVRFSAPAQPVSVAFRVPGGTSGVAWADLPTKVSFKIYVFDTTCRLLGSTRLPDTGGTIGIGPTAVSATSAITIPGAATASGSGFGYDGRCHAAMRRAIAAGQ